MPAFETMDLHDYAVLFPRVGQDRYAEPTVSSGVEIRCRIVRKKREIPSKDNTKVAIDATVVVDRDVVVGSILWEGRRQSLAPTYLPSSDLLEVKSIDITRDIKGRVTRRELLCSIFNDSMPTVVS